MMNKTCRAVGGAMAQDAATTSNLPPETNQIWCNGWRKSNGLKRETLESSNGIISVGVRHKGIFTLGDSSKSNDDLAMLQLGLKDRCM